MPLRVIDGVPESVHHSLKRNRHQTRSGFMPHEEGARDYLNDPTWYLGLNEEYERIKGELMEE